LFAGLDVGSTSARAGLFDASGKLVATARHAIQTWTEAGDIVEQSSEDIWEASVAALRTAMHLAGATAADVAGLAFDATCSLVVLDPHGQPLAVGPSGDPQRNVVVWMDHRAISEAKDIDATRSEVLRYVGGTISPEMELPKLLWLKRHMPRSFAAAGDFFDLTDFLTWRATGSRTRSLCTLTCKWTYLAHESRWDDHFLGAIGLEALTADAHARIGAVTASPGTALGSGLTPAAATQLGLMAGIPVAAGLIDAHAGGIGTIGGTSLVGHPNDPLRRVAYIMGTSACIMATTREPVFVPGVWGPYLSAMMPGLWLNEGGQSAAGVAIDHIVGTHPAFGEAKAAASNRSMDVLGYLEDRIVARGGGALSEAVYLAADRHTLPEFLGNRSPHADPESRSVAVGMKIDKSIDDLERSYLAALCGLAYGLADVVDALADHGIVPDTIVASGGASHSALVRQILADATGIPIALAETTEPVLLGAAMLAAVAAAEHASLPFAMAAMSNDRAINRPAVGKVRAFHVAKREIYKSLRQTERQARRMMASWHSG
jgi:D-ribulokinase